MKVEHQDKIDRYVMKRMTEAELSAFERELAEDDELKEQVQFTQSVRDVIKSRQEKIERMMHWQDEEEFLNRNIANSESAADSYSEQYYEDEKNTVTKKGSNRLILWTSSIAAILIAGFFFFNNNSATDSLEETLIHTPTTIFRGADNNGILDLVKDKEYGKALLSVSNEKQVIEKERDILLLDSTLSAEEKEYNIMLLDTKLHEMLWLEANILIHLDRKKDAIKILDKLCKGNGEYKQLADSLLNVISIK